jgi:thiamine biosynthesis lipoprotein
MGTVVSFRVVGSGARTEPTAWQRVERAEAWFRHVEAACSRFEPESELRRLCGAPGRPAAASALLFPVVEYALRVADASGGAFDPTVGLRMEARGFDRNWRTGKSARSGGDAQAGSTVGSASYRDVVLDSAHRTIELRRPLLLDLGALAKGFAVDMAVRELLPLGSFMVDAGGDVYVSGTNEHGRPWCVGVRHPRSEREVIETITASAVAICTSGDYERRPSADGHHLLDPRTGASASAAASVTVLAPTAMAADALATAAFVLGPTRGVELLEREGLQGLFLTPDLERVTTASWPGRPAGPGTTRAVEVPEPLGTP